MGRGETDTILFGETLFRRLEPKTRNAVVRDFAEANAARYLTFLTNHEEAALRRRIDEITKKRSGERRAMVIAERDGGKTGLLLGKNRAFIPLAELIDNDLLGRWYRRVVAVREHVQEALGASA